MQKVTNKAPVTVGLVEKKRDAVSSSAVGKDLALTQLFLTQDRAFGAILGSFIGDSIGSYLEFEMTREGVSAQAIEQAMSMPGGGCWKLAPGQVTEDSELAMCLLNALVESKGTLDMNELCKWYGCWANTEPFSIDKDLKQTLGLCDPSDPNPSKSFEAASDEIGMRNTSQTNLSRVIPLAVWTHKLTKWYEVDYAMRCDLNFTSTSEQMAEFVLC